MSVEISIPFRLDISGRIAQTQDPDAQANQHVMSLVSTTPGERVMQPDYGVNLQDYVFDSGDFSAEAALIQNDVSVAMAKWEPTLTLNGVAPAGNSEVGVVSLEVDFSRQPGNLSAPVQSATVLVGGTVVQDS